VGDPEALRSARQSSSHTQSPRRQGRRRHSVARWETQGQTVSGFRPALRICGRTERSRNADPHPVPAPTPYSVPSTASLASYGDPGGSTAGPTRVVDGRPAGAARASLTNIGRAVGPPAGTRPGRRQRTGDTTRSSTLTQGIRRPIPSQTRPKQQNLSQCVKPGFEFPSLPRSQIPHAGHVLNRSPVSNSPGSQEAGLGEGMVKTPARFLSLSR
jgi:hypothetical protein